MEKSYKFKYQSSKKALQALNRYNYYLQEVIPTVFASQFEKSDQQTGRIHFSIGKNNVMYYWGKNYSEGELVVNQYSIMHSIKATYLAKNSQFDNVFKINEKSYQKVLKINGTFWNYTTNVSQILEFVIKSQENKTTKKNKYELYVIHHCQNQLIEQKVKQLKWNHFVQKYEFCPTGVSYQVVAVANQDKYLFGLYNNQNSMLSYVESYLKFDKFQGCLMKYQSAIKSHTQKTQDPAFSQQHNIMNQIPTQHIKMFYTLKNQFGAQKQQLVCRFMIARQFNQEQTRKSIQEYLRWYKEITSKYKWEDFEPIHKMNIYYYLGEDYKGRPVILNKAKNVLVNQMDEELYCQYFLYFLEVYMPTKMRGHVTQLNILADVEGVGQNNFKWAITKRNTDQGKSYCVERQFKFFAVNVSSFAYFCWKFIKPLLPQKTLDKVDIGGSSKQQIVKSLLKDMSIDVIPTYLGGRNPVI